MSTAQRAADGLMTSLLRRQSRALHPRGPCRHGGRPASERTPALLVMGVQRAIADLCPDVAHRAAEAVRAARDAGMPVIFGGAPDDAALVHPALAPLPGEPIVAGRRAGGFAGSELDLLLRARGACSLVLCGSATSAMVRAAADLDFELTVLRDACADADADDGAFARRANLVDVAAWAAGLAGRG